MTSVSLKSPRKPDYDEFYVHQDGDCTCYYSQPNPCCVSVYENATHSTFIEMLVLSMAPEEPHYRDENAHYQGRCSCKHREKNANCIVRQYNVQKQLWTHLQLLIEQVKDLQQSTPVGVQTSTLDAESNVQICEGLAHELKDFSDSFLTKFENIERKLESSRSKSLDHFLESQPKVSEIKIPEVKIHAQPKVDSIPIGIQDAGKDLTQLIDNLERENIELQLKCQTYKQLLATIEKMPVVPKVEPSYDFKDCVVVSMDDLIIEIQELKRHVNLLEKENVTLRDQCVFLKNMDLANNTIYAKPNVSIIDRKCMVSNNDSMFGSYRVYSGFTPVVMPKVETSSTSTPKTVVKRITFAKTNPKPILYQSLMYSKPSSSKTSKTLENPKPKDQGTPKSTKPPRKSTWKPETPKTSTQYPLKSSTQPKKSPSPGHTDYSSYRTNRNKPFLVTVPGKNGDPTSFRDQYGWFSHVPKKPSAKRVSETTQNPFSKHVSAKKWNPKPDSFSPSTSSNSIKYSVPELLTFKPRPMSLAKPKSFDFPLRPQNLFFNDTPCIKPRWNALSISQIDSTYKWYSKSFLK